MSRRSQAALNRRNRSVEPRAKRKSLRSTLAFLDRPNTKSVGLATLLFVLTIWVYFPAIHHPFVNYDDPDYVTDNQRVQQGITANTLSWAFTTMESANWHPLTWLSHALDCELFGLHPSGHHTTSLVLHALNVALLFLLLWKATEKSGRSFFVAGLFAFHPINVETVAWVAERKSVLCMLFILLTLGAYGWYVRSPNISRYLVVMLFFGLALLAKPMAVTFPFALLLLDFWPLHRVSNTNRNGQPSPTPRYPLSMLAVEKLPLLAMTVASCVVTVIAQRKVIRPLQIIPLGARIVNAIYSYVTYISKALWPSHLAVFYAQQGARLGIHKIALCVTILAALSVLACKYRSHSYFLGGWLWFLGTLVPMIGIVQVGDQGMADRYAYMSFLGLFVAATWGLADLAAKYTVDWRWTACAAAVVLVTLSLLTRQQLQTWESNTALWTRSLEVTPDNYIAHDLVGLAISQESFLAGGQSCPDEALAHFQSAILLNPGDTLGHMDDGYCQLGHKHFQEAISQYQQALQSAPNSYLKSRAYSNLGGAYQDSGDYSSSRDAYRRALEISPHDADILRDIARLDAREQIARLSKEAATKPEAEVYVQLGHAQQMAGDAQGAVISYQHALRLNPNFSPASDALRNLRAAGP